MSNAALPQGGNSSSTQMPQSGLAGQAQMPQSGLAGQAQMPQSGSAGQAQMPQSSSAGQADGMPNIPGRQATIPPGGSPGIVDPASVIAQLRNVTKVYGMDQAQVVALNDVSVDLYRSQLTTIMGPSGSGKSTLLHTMAGLDSVTNGEIAIDGVRITALKDKELTLFRRDKIGFVFQSFNLIPTLTARANIELPLRLAGKKADKGWFDAVVSSLELTDRLSHKPYQLSGGQQQRVAVARALLARPAILVADEPTGNLDSRSSAEVLQLLRTAVDQLKQTVVMVTHDKHAAAIGDRMLVVRDGQIVHDIARPTVHQIEEVC